MSGRNSPSEQMSELSIYGADRGLTDWEKSADLMGESVLLDQVNATSLRLGVSALQHIRDQVFNDVKRKRYGKKPNGNDISVNIAPFRDFIDSSQMNSFFWGSVFAVENLKNLGFTFDNREFPIAFSGQEKNVHSLMFLPSEGDIVEHFADKLPFSIDELKSMREGIERLSIPIVSLTQSKLSNIINSVTGSGQKSWTEVKSDLIGALLPFTGSKLFRAIETGDSIDAPNLASIVKQCNYNAFNKGKLAVFNRPECSDFLGGLQFVGLCVSDGDSKKALDTRVF